MSYIYGDQQIAKQYQQQLNQQAEYEREQRIQNDVNLAQKFQAEEAQKQARIMADLDAAKRFEEEVM